MKHFIIKLALASSVLITFLAHSPTIKAAPPQLDETKVQINEELMLFPDVQPFVDDAHLLQIPIRVLSQKLNYEINWEHVGESIKITLNNSKQTFSFTTGERTAIQNGNPFILDSVPQVIGGSTYVPLRALANALGIRIQWDNRNRIAILNQDGNYHAPAWYMPTYKLIEAKATAYTGSSEENGGFEGRDYFGNPLVVGTVSVDPSVIPLGSRLYIEGYQYQGLPVDGFFASATDIGGAIKGNKIDIYVPDGKEKAVMFGIQQVKVYILDSE